MRVIHRGHRETRQGDAFSKRILQGKLNEPRIYRRAGNLAKGRIGHAGVRIRELRMIEDIVEFRAESQPDFLSKPLAYQFLLASFPS